METSLSLMGNNLPKEMVPESKVFVFSQKGPFKQVELKLSF